MNEQLRNVPTPDWPAVRESKQLAIALQASLEAGILLKKAFYGQFETHVKEDKSDFTPFDEQAEVLASRIIKKY